LGARSPLAGRGGNLVLAFGGGDLLLVLQVHDLDVE
jgi:hypothetical protein